MITEKEGVVKKEGKQEVEREMKKDSFFKLNTQKPLGEKNQFCLTCRV